MSIDKSFYKIKNLIGFYIFQYPRILKYKLLSNCKNITGTPRYNQPVQLLGDGNISFGKNVKLGVNPSPYLYSGYGYMDVRKKSSKIVIGDNVWLNNNFTIVSEGEGIEIGSDSIIGLNIEIIDSDFHDLDPNKRLSGVPKSAKVTIGKNVFIGNGVKILKGVTIGDNSVIASSSVVIKSIPANVIAGGYPCKVIKHFDGE